MVLERGTLSRRGFLRRSLGVLAMAGLPSWYARELLAFEEGKDSGSGESILMGAIGIGSPQSRGRAIKNDALNVKGAGVRYIAVCDVDKRHREAAAKEIQDAGGECKVHEDYRELLENKDIQAVTIATPDHWHALVAIEALRKGKDVYCEKPLTLTVAEAIAVAKVAKGTERIFQTGSQQRSDARFRLACELVRNGRIGKVVRVETRIGSNPQSPSLPKADVPEGLNWDFWLGPTPMVDYVEAPNPNSKTKIPYSRCHYEFRWWYDYSGGKMTDWGAHHNDIAQWGLGMDESGPVAVEADCAEPSKEANSYNCHPTFKVTYTYDNGAKLVCANTQLDGAPDPKKTEGKPGNFSHDNGVLFVGEDDKWIFVCRSGITASDAKLIEEPLPDDRKVKLYVSNNHMENFLIGGVKNRKPCICAAEVGARSVTVCHLGVIAMRSGKKLKWDPVKQELDDKDANTWLSRPMRKPWKIEV